MINNTNLEFFNSKQKAELFRLKGVFLTSLGAKQEANNAYSHAVQVCWKPPRLLVVRAGNGRRLSKVFLPTTLFFIKECCRGSGTRFRYTSCVVSIYVSKS